MRGRVERIRNGVRVLLLGSMALAALGAAQAPASAGAWGLGKGDSPDMALVIAGDTGRTTTLHAGERDFGRLWRLLSPRYTGTERVPEAWTHGRFPEVRVTVIWGLTGVGGWPQTSRAPGGDVAVERQDQLFLTPDGTLWVRSDPSPDVRL